MRILLAAFLLFPGIAGAAQCRAQSGPGTAALVELYTSDGCSSCAPADRWLSALSSRAPSSVVPLALHVAYWDYIGGKDTYAKREFSLRQRKFTRLQRMALVYTPQIMLQGRDFRGWGSEAFDEAVARINAQPAKANLKLAILAADADGLEIEAAAELAKGLAAADLYLATYQGRLVLQWQGPYALPAGSLTERRKLALLPGAAPADSGVAAFVQDRRTGEVLQALLRSSC